MAKRGYKPRYTRDEVLRAAIELFETPEPVTMKRLAEHLDIGVMTLYGYVANKDDLTQGVAGLLFDDLGRGVGDDAPWDEQVRAQAADIHALVIRHPNLARALRAEHPPEPSLYRVRERMLAVLVGAGFAPEPALRAVGILTAYAQGFALVQSSVLDRDVMRSRIQDLPADEFPALREHRDAYPDHVSDASFHHGLDLLIAGLREERRDTAPRG